MRDTVAHGLLARERFPPADGGLDVLGIDVYRVAGTPEFFGRDDRGAAAGERIVDGLARDGVVQDRDLEEAHRLLRRVSGDRVVGRTGATERVEVRDLPHSGLASIAAPLPFA